MSTTLKMGWGGLGSDGTSVNLKPGNLNLSHEDAVLVPGGRGCGAEGADGTGQATLFFVFATGLFFAVLVHQRCGALFSDDPASLFHKVVVRGIVLLKDENIL